MFFMNVVGLASGVFTGGSQMRWVRNKAYLQLCNAFILVMNFFQCFTLGAQLLEEPLE